MSERDELVALRRMAELEARAGPAPNAKQQIAGDAITRGAMDPTQGMSWLDKFNAGMGKAFTDLGRAGGQMVGVGPSADEVRDTRKLDAPLMNTGAGTAGNIAGNIAAFAPLAVVPGANTVAGAGALGAVTGAFQPTEGAGERLTNMGVGTALGAGSQYAATTGAQKVGEWGARKQTEAAARESQNAVRDQTLREGRDAGFVLPRSAVDPSFLSNRLESVAGKAATAQQASVENKQLADVLARKAGGLRPDEAISMPNLKSARQRMSEPYREIAAISPEAAAALDEVKKAKLESKLQWNSHNRSGDVDAYKAAVAADAKAEAQLDIIDQAAKASGRPDLLDALKKARVDIAKNHQVRNAVNVGTGSIEPSVIGKALDRNPNMTGELKTIGAFQQAYPRYMADNPPPPGVGKLEAALAASLGAGGYSASDSPYGAALGVLPLLSHPARAAVLSRALQPKPNYSPGVTAKAAATLEDPETRRRVALLARSLALPAAANQ